MTHALTAMVRRVLRACLPHGLATRLADADAPDARAREEMDLHIALETERLIATGMAAPDARRHACAAFGGVTRYAEEMRDGRRWSWAEASVREIRHAGRALWRAPRHTVATITVLALGLGVNAAVFALLSAALLRPLPYHAPERLVVLMQEVDVAGRRSERRWSYAEYAALRDTLATVAPVAAVAADDVNLSGSGDAVRVRVETVSASYFDVLGLQPRLGRFFDVADDSSAGGPRAVISHGLWRSRFGEASSVVGEPIHLNGVAHVVAGVAPRGVDGVTGGVDVWIPHAMAPRVTYPDHLTTTQHFLTIIGRLAPHQSLDSVQAEVGSAGAATAASARLARGEPAEGQWSATAASLDVARRHPATVRLHLALAAVALLVLVLAVVDASSLVLTRTLGRGREFAIRAALGAGRARLVRSVVVESCAIGLAGGVLGVGLAALLLASSADSVAALLHLGPGSTGLDIQPHAAPVLDWRVLAATVVLSIISGAAAGMTAAGRAVDVGRNADLTSARGASEPSRPRHRAWLPGVIVVQVAGAFALLVSAGSLLQALDGIVSRDMGVQTDGVTTFWVAPPELRYGGGEAGLLLARLLEQVEAVAGVQGASVGRCAPLVSCSWTSVQRAGAPGADTPMAGRHYVAPSHFSVLGVPLLRGRSLADTDRAGAPLVGVVNASGARLLWPGEDPIGQRVRFGSGGPFADPQQWTTIVGVVGDVPYARSGRVGIDVYTSYHQFTWPETMVLVRSARDAVSLVPDLRAAVAAVDPTLSVHDVRSLGERTAGAIAHERFATTAVTGFAILGLLLATLGVYGVLAHAVARRRRELAIRLALGATRTMVVRLVTGRVLWLVLAGLAPGATAAWMMGSQLTLAVPEAAILPPRVVLFAVVALVASALAACVLPAWHAARTDPATTLAAE